MEVGVFGEAYVKRAISSLLMVNSQEVDMETEIAFLDTLSPTVLIQKYVTLVSETDCSLASGMFNVSLVKTIMFMEQPEVEINSVVNAQLIDLLHSCDREGLFDPYQASLQKTTYVLLPQCILPLASRNRVRGGDA